MLTSLDSGVSAMQQFQQELDVLGNDIANVNTAGFKSSSVNFADALSQTLQAGGGRPSLQVGTGVLTDSISGDFSQGSINSTGNPNDLAISGNGFFIVRDPATGADYATRAGNFTVDTNGYLVTSDGFRVQGYSDSALSTVGDIKIDNTGSGSTSPLTKYNFNKDGTLTVTLQDGTSFTRGQVLLQNFQSPQNLVREGGNLFSGISQAGGLASPAAPGTGGVGSIQDGALEGSNVDLTVALSSLITTQRAYEASAHVITTSDEVLQTLVNLKH